MTRNARGFTLIELLIVIVIIGIVLGLTMLSPVFDSPGQKVQSQLLQFNQRFERMQDQALQTNQFYGVDTLGNQVRWWQYDQDERIWQLIEEHATDAALQLQLLVDEATIAKDQPTIVISPDLTTTPFTLQIDSMLGSERWLSDGFNPLQPEGG